MTKKLDEAWAVRKINTHFSFSGQAAKGFGIAAIPNPYLAI